MQKSLKNFSKYQGAGNDFILFEDFEEDFPHHLIPKLCHRHFGIGGDGLILLRHSKIADYQMVYFNADGTPARMCGNGLRCFVHYLRDRYEEKIVYAIEVGGRVLTVKADREKIVTFFPPPTVLNWGMTVNDQNVYLVDSGVVHGVIFATEPEDMLQIGESLCFDQNFHPQGVNINIVQIEEEDRLQLMTFEKGVGKTLACGTGAVAAAYVAHQLGFCRERVEVFPPSQEKIEILLGNEIEITGPSKQVFEGQIPL